MKASKVLTFPDLLEVLGHDSHVSICHQHPGSVFHTQVVAASDAPFEVTKISGANVWFGVNPIAGPPRRDAGRGTAEQVQRLAALYADLDVKPGGLNTFNDAHAVVADLAAILGTPPSAVVLSGNGLQPYWPIEDDITGPDARALLRRFGRLVANMAERRGGRVDSVYDLARVLRVPGTNNLKGEPKPVVGLAEPGRPLESSEIDERLLEYGVTEQPEDRETLTEVVAAPSEWKHADKTCFYVRQMIEGWKTETPTARHPWLLSQTTRLAAAHRAGCLATDDHTAALDVLVGRFRHMLTIGEPRAEQPGEISDAISWGQARISVKPDDQVISELGDHSHDDAILQLIEPPAPPMGLNIDPAAPPMGLTVIQGGKSTTDGSTALKPAPTPSTLERSEDGHSQHLIATYGDLIKYCAERGAWLAWDGTVWQWQPKGGGIVREYAKNVARTFGQGDQGALSHKRRALSASGTDGCLKQAQSDKRVVVRIADLDNHPWMINTPAGMVDLRTGQAHPPDPAMLATKMTAAAPDFDHTEPIFESFLDDTFGDNHELRGYVQRLAGISLVGTVLEQILLFAHGPGANGKSTLFEALMHAAGIGPTGYAIAAPAEMLMIRKHSEHPAELAQLAGARLVVCSELDDGQRFAEAKIKQLTGRDSINARFLYGQPFTFSPSHTMWLLGNHRPQARTGGLAFWRRVKLLEFSRIVPAERRDPALGDKLATAAAAVLAWAIRGAVDYAKNGIGEPAEVSEAVEAYAADQDTIGRFVEDQVHLAPNAKDAVKVAVADVHRAYEQWCSDVGESPATVRRLSHELAERFNIESRKGSKGRRFYHGLMLLNAGDEEDTGTDSEVDNSWS